MYILGHNSGMDESPPEVVIVSCVISMQLVVALPGYWG